MYYTELDPYTLEKVYVPKTPGEKAMQRALMQYFIPKNKDIVFKALKAAGRLDLVGSSKKCLITAPENYNPEAKKKKDKFKKYSRKSKKGKKR